MLEEGPKETFRFSRPLRLGGGYQMVCSRGVLFRLSLTVTSARFLRIQQQLGKAKENAALNGYGAEGVVVDQDMEWVSSYSFSNNAYEEDVAWYFDEFERLFLPALEHLQTARDLYEWYWDERWKPFATGRGLWRSIYAARYLPDAAFLPILDEFKAEVDFPIHGFAQFMRTQPQFSDGLI